MTLAKLALAALIVLGPEAIGLSIPFESALRRAEPAFETQIAKTRKVLDQLRAGDVPAIMAGVDPSLQGAKTEAQIRQILTFVPTTPIETSDVVALTANRNALTGETRTMVLMQIGTNGTFTSLETDFKAQNGVETMIGLHVRRMSQSFEAATAFSFNRPAWMLASGVAWVSMVAILIAGTYAALTAAGMRLHSRVLWILAMMVGVGTLSLNWQTGAVTGQWLSLGGPAFNVAKAGPAAAWMVSAHLPIGVLAFWLRRLMRRTPIRATAAPEA